MTFRKWLLAKMKAHGWTQHSLGQLIGVSQVTVSQWLRGRNGPDARVLAKLAEVTDTDALWLFRLVGYLPAAAKKAAANPRETERAEWLGLLEDMTPEQRRKAIAMVREIMNFRKMDDDA